jgi:hypothetical protein
MAAITARKVKAPEATKDTRVGFSPKLRSVVAIVAMKKDNWSYI